MNQHSASAPILSVQGLRPSERQHLRPPGPGVPCHRRRVGDGLGACTGRSQLGPPSALPASALTGKPHGLIVKRLRTNMKASWQIRPGALCFDLVNCHRSVSFSCLIFFTNKPLAQKTPAPWPGAWRGRARPRAFSMHLLMACKMSTPITGEG